MNIRQTVGGAQNVGHFVVLEGLQLVPRVEPTEWSNEKEVAPTFHGAKNELHANLAHLGLADVGDILGLHLRDDRATEDRHPHAHELSHRRRRRAPASR